MQNNVRNILSYILSFYGFTSTQSKTFLWCPFILLPLKATVSVVSSNLSTLILPEAEVHKDTIISGAPFVYKSKLLPPSCRTITDMRCRLEENVNWRTIPISSDEIYNRTEYIERHSWR